MKNVSKTEPFQRTNKQNHCFRTSVNISNWMKWWPNQFNVYKSVFIAAKHLPVSFLYLNHKNYVFVKGKKEIFYIFKQINVDYFTNFRIKIDDIDFIFKVRINLHLHCYYIKTCDSHRDMKKYASCRKILKEGKPYTSIGEKVVALKMWRNLKKWIDIVVIKTWCCPKTS